MKKITTLIFLIISFAIIMFGCGSKSDLEGKWRGVKEIHHTMEFKENGVVILGNAGQEAASTYKFVDKGRVQLGEKQNMVVQYSVNGDELTINYGSEVDKYRRVKKGEKPEDYLPKLSKDEAEKIINEAKKWPENYTYRLPMDGKTFEYRDGRENWQKVSSYYAELQSKGYITIKIVPGEFGSKDVLLSTTNKGKQIFKQDKYNSDYKITDIFRKKIANINSVNITDDGKTTKAIVKYSWKTEPTSEVSNLVYKIATAEHSIEPDDNTKMGDTGKITATLEWDEREGKWDRETENNN